MTRYLPVLTVLFAASCPWMRPHVPVPPPTTTTTTSTTTTTMRPEPPQCRPPQGVEWTQVVDGPMFAGSVNYAMKSLTGCDVGSTCVHGHLDVISWASAEQEERYVLEERAAQNWMAAVAKALRATGLCAGQADEGHSDGVMVGRTCGGAYTEYKIANYGGGKVVWSPGADRGSWRPASGRCSP